MIYPAIRSLTHSSDWPGPPWGTTHEKQQGGWVMEIGQIRMSFDRGLCCYAGKYEEELASLITQRNVSVDTLGKHIEYMQVKTPKSFRDINTPKLASQDKK